MNQKKIAKIFCGILLFKKYENSHEQAWNCSLILKFFIFVITFFLNNYNTKSN